VLRELRVRNFAVIDEVRLELEPGLTVLSGETGAGKSILVEALSLLLGERASSDLVRQGEERALVEGCFDLASRPELIERCVEAGLEVEDEWLIVRRELQHAGRNRVWVNGSPATAGLIRELGAALVDLHGQHEHQALLQRAAQRRILDAYAGADGRAEQVEEAFRELTSLRTRIAQVKRKASEALERSDYLRFKAEEIASANLEPGEEEQLTADASRLSNSEELLSLSSALHERAYEGEGSLVDQLGALRKMLDDLASIDPETEAFAELYQAAVHALQELGRRLGDYRDTVEHDPDRLESVRARLDQIFRLKGKYGSTVDDVLAVGEAARSELERLEMSEAEVARLEKEATGAERELDRLAAGLSEARREAAERLVEAAGRLLPELGMKGGRFEVRLTPLETVGPSGREVVEFLVTLNPGFEPGPLARIASGGEMSRLMLALKSALVEVDDVPSLVFDEIDAGVGGEVAHRVAELLARVADRHQVFVVTHLAQIAARADSHLQVHKSSGGERPSTRVTALDGEERVRELARMLGGDPESDVSRSHAEELLSTARV
jgi:DNA repair protein RecN (Recombination protein N)